MDQPNYFAVIPAEVRYDTELSAGAKLLYGEISALCNKEGFCWATNAYFSQLYQATPRTISRHISQLVERGHLKAEGNESEARKLTAVWGWTKMSTPTTELSRGVDRNVQGGRQNCLGVINKTMNKKTNIQEAHEVMTFFNSVFNKQYKLNSARRDLIDRRLKDGYTLEQLKTAIINFSKDEWPERHRFCDLVYCIGVRNKVDNLEKWLNTTPKKAEPKPGGMDWL